MDRVLALDLGSSSVRALVLDGETLDALPQGLARRDVRLTQSLDGTAELDAEHYVEAVVACLDELAEHRLLGGVHTVAWSSQWHSLLGLAANGDPVGPGLSWLDTRPTLTGPGPAEAAEYHARTGAWWHPLYWPVRLRWLAAQGVTARHWLGLPEYVTGQLLGAAEASVSSASGTGALNTIHCHWDEEAVTLSGVPGDAYPTLLPDGWTGRLRADWARRWPDLAEASWSAPSGDGAASAIGSGCFTPDRVSVTVGTSAAVRMVADGAPDPAYGVWRYRVDVRRSVLGVGYSAGGALHEWLTRLLAPGGVDEPALARLAPGEHGLVTLPFQAGHRPPQQPRGLGGTIHGLRISTGPVEVAAGVLEGLCHELARGVAALDHDHGAVPVLSGGAVAASPWFARRLAAALPPGALRMTTPEVAARGAAMLATGREVAPELVPVGATDAERAAMAEAAVRHRELAALLSSP